MDSFNPEVSPDDEGSQLLLQFINWWIDIHQREMWRVEIRELYDQLDQHYESAQYWQEQAFRHQRIIDNLELCRKHLAVSQYMFFLEESVVSFLFREISRSLTFESIISQRMIGSKPPCPWTFFGISELSTLKCRMENLVDNH